MTDYIIIGLLALIWISNTRYGARFGNALSNFMAHIRHKIR